MQTKSKSKVASYSLPLFLQQLSLRSATYEGVLHFDYVLQVDGLASTVAPKCRQPS